MIRVETWRLRGKLDWSVRFWCTITAEQTCNGVDRSIMAGASTRLYGEAIELLWGTGTCAALSDGQLLARFLAKRDEAGELAFEALVKRHGPMVERVCRQSLEGPSDIHDAWQAVFLVLAQRGHSIRNRESLGAWLYGVALRATKRARVTAIGHGVRDRRINEAAQLRALASDAPASLASCDIERGERCGTSCIRRSAAFRRNIERPSFFATWKA